MFIQRVNRSVFKKAIFAQRFLQRSILSFWSFRNCMSRSEMDVLVFGSAAVDFICYLPRLPKAGETLHGHKFVNGYGGKGANQCVAAARLGARAAMIAKLGDDVWGSKYYGHLKEEGVDVSHVQQCPNETTGVALINVADNGENQITIAAGANNLLSDVEVKEATSLFHTAKVLLCQFEVPLPASLEALRVFKGISILNASPALANTSKEFLECAKILCVNETETALMTGVAAISNLNDAKTGLIKLINMGGNTVIITLGALGAVYNDKNQKNKCFHVPAPKVERVVDTTGAGDAFLGALGYFMARFPDQPIYQHIGAACEVASFSVQRPGTQASFPKSNELTIDLRQRSFEFTEL